MYYENDIIQIDFDTKRMKIKYSKNNEDLGYAFTNVIVSMNEYRLAISLLSDKDEVEILRYLECKPLSDYDYNAEMERKQWESAKYRRYRKDTVETTVSVSVPKQETIGIREGMILFGTVKYWNSEKGYGFLTADNGACNGEDIFIQLRNKMLCLLICKCDCV